MDAKYILCVCDICYIQKQMLSFKIKVKVSFKKALCEYFIPNS